MTNFPSGLLVLREFPSMTLAHQAASELAAAAAAEKFDLHLVEVSATAGGAWVCAWSPASAKESLEKTVMRLHLETLNVTEALMNAYLSLSPKPNSETSTILILEAETIADVFRSAQAYVNAGATLIEIRVKRAGPSPGAYAYLTSEKKELVVSCVVKAAVIDLVGDYRRYFI
jgi:hypothetical protein